MGEETSFRGESDKCWWMNWAGLGEIGLRLRVAKGWRIACALFLLGSSPGLPVVAMQSQVGVEEVP